jgi:hypothetical protein
LSYGGWIIGKHGFLIHPPLQQADTFPVFYIYSGNNKHGSRLALSVLYLVFSV